MGIFALSFLSLAKCAIIKVNEALHGHMRMHKGKTS